MPSCILAFLTARRKLGAAPISAKIWVSFSDSAVALGVSKDGVAAVAGGAAGRAALVEEGWLAGAFLPVERRGASGRAASSGQRRGRVVEPIRQRLDQKGQEKMGQNPRLCGALLCSLDPILARYWTVHLRPVANLGMDVFVPAVAPLFWS